MITTPIPAKESNIAQVNSFHTDRSRVETAQYCPRKRFYSYHYNGIGIQVNKLALALHVGSSVHKGIERLLKRDDLITALGKALTYYDEECQAKIFADAEADMSQSYMYIENRYLVESLIRIYAVKQLPRLLEEFTVLAVEEEIEWSLAPNITFLSRPDAILQQKETGDIYVFSLKTASSWMDGDRGTEAQSKIDNQGMSELIATEAWLKAKNIELGRTAETGLPEKVMGIKYEYLIKCSYYKSPSDNKCCAKGDKFYTSNQVIHPYFNSNSSMTINDLFNLAFYYSYEDELGNSKRLGKGWDKVNIWDIGSGNLLAEWIDLLAQMEREPLEQFIRTPEPYYRNSADVEEFIESTAFNEDMIQAKALTVNNPGRIDRGKLLNVLFPKYRHSCFTYGSKCQFFEFCHENVDPESALACGDFAYRIPNHPAELVILANKSTNNTNK